MTRTIFFCLVATLFALTSCSNETPLDRYVATINQRYYDSIQEVKENKMFIAATYRQAPAKDTIIKGKQYQIQKGKRGGRYIIVTSRTGKEYKRYLKD